MAWWVRIFAAKFEDPHGSRRKRESYKLSVSHSLTATYILWHVKNLNIKKKLSDYKKNEFSRHESYNQGLQCKQFHNKQIILKCNKCHLKVYFRFLD